MKAILVIAIIFLIVLVLKKPAFGNEAKLLGQVAPDFNLKNSQDYYETAISLPNYFHLTKKEIYYVINIIKKFFNKK